MWLEIFSTFVPTIALGNSELLFRVNKSGLYVEFATDLPLTFFFLFSDVFPGPVLSFFLRFFIPDPSIHTSTLAREVLSVTGNSWATVVNGLVCSTHAIS